MNSLINFANFVNFRSSNGDYSASCARNVCNSYLLMNEKRIPENLYKNEDKIWN